MHESPRRVGSSRHTHPERTALSLAPEIRALIDGSTLLGAAISSLPLDQQRIAIQAELDEMFRANPASAAALANVDIADSPARGRRR